MVEPTQQNVAGRTLFWHAGGEGPGIRRRDSGRTGAENELENREKF